MLTTKKKKRTKYHSQRAASGDQASKYQNNLINNTI